MDIEYFNCNGVRNDDSNFRIQKPTTYVISDKEKQRREKILRLGIVNANDDVFVVPWINRIPQRKIDK